MKNKPTVSLVIPAYNEEGYIKACLEAATHQSRPFFEIIVVDNNSTDKTAAIAQSYPGVSVLTESEQGLRASRNAGFDAASGDIIARIDADSLVKPNWCQRVAKLFRDQPIMAVSGSCYYYDMPAKAVGLALDNLGRKLAFALDQPFLYGSNMALRRSAWSDIRSQVCMKGEFFEDCDLSIHIAGQGGQILFDKKLVAGVSARRFIDSPREFYRYMSQFDHTFAMHDKRSASAKAAKYMFLSTYVLMKLPHKLYNSDRRPLRVNGFRRKTATRPSANT